MNRTTAVTIVIFFILLTAGALAFFRMSGTGSVKKPHGLYTNEGYISGLYTDLDLNDPADVFQYIFAGFDDEVEVFPTENYYYFDFTATGRTLSGSLLFSVGVAERGMIDFGYAVKSEQRTRQKYFRIKGGYHRFAEDDSVYVERIDDFKYTVTYRGRTVTFKFYDMPVEQPKSMKLARNEVFVGPNFDDSGLRFHLVFNEKSKRLYWVLNEDYYVPESFAPFSENVVIGKRTDYAFYNDTLHNRKILVGVNGLNVLHNNWFDGPFDQMPDNYVRARRIKVKDYLLAHYNFDDDRIDKYGKFTNQDNARLPVAPYTVYFSRDDLKFVDSLKMLNLPEEQFFARITEQVYKTPDDYYSNVKAKMR